MKTLFRFLLATLAPVLVLAACVNGDDSLDRSWVSYGVIKGTSDNFYILRDDGARLEVAVNKIPQVQCSDGERVMVSYNILGTDGTDVHPPTYNIRLKGIYSILSKYPIERAFIDADPEKRADSIGNDAINVLDAWFGGDYLNLNLGILRTNASHEHMVNLVHEYGSDVPGNDTLYLTLCHNGYDPAYKCDLLSRVSFDIADCIPAGKTSVPVKLTWTDYWGTRWDSGTFALGAADVALSPAYSAGKSAATDKIPSRIK